MRFDLIVCVCVCVRCTGIIKKLPRSRFTPSFWRVCYKITKILRKYLLIKEKVCMKLRREREEKKRKRKERYFEPNSEVFVLFQFFESRNCIPIILYIICIDFEKTNLNERKMTITKKWNSETTEIMKFVDQLMNEKWIEKWWKWVIQFSWRGPRDIAMDSNSSHALPNLLWVFHWNYE